MKNLWHTTQIKANKQRTVKVISEEERKPPSADEKVKAEDEKKRTQSKDNLPGR